MAFGGKFYKQLEVFGKNGGDVYNVRAVYAHYGSGKIDYGAKEFLGYVASIPYDGAKQKEARKWVKDNINKNRAKTQINGVTFEIYFSGDRNRTLTIYVNENWLTFD
ncbi:hypothetical protein N9C35_03485 [Flavobacteriaceae bacterium]|nr:hypothetical protein [Flavobacteriaceae bacterium]